jgi:hypothetical protein
MKKQEKIIEKNYKIHAAGDLWSIPEVHFVRNSVGELSLTKQEIDKINASIANYICSQDKELTWGQFDFLCKVTATKYSQIASMLRIDKSTVSKWKNGKLDYLASFVLKQYFWQTIFAEYLKEVRGHAIDDQLKNMGEKAIKEKWANAIGRAA